MVYTYSGHFNMYAYILVLVCYADSGCVYWKTGIDE